MPEDFISPHAARTRGSEPYGLPEGFISPRAARTLSSRSTTRRRSASPALLSDSTSVPPYENTLRNTVRSLLLRNPGFGPDMEQKPTTKQGYARRIPAVLSPTLGGGGASTRRALQDAGRKPFDGDGDGKNIFSLDKTVLQLLDEKYIAGRLYPKERNDDRIAVRKHHLKHSNRFKDSDIIATPCLGARLISQGLSSIHVVHPTDGISCLHPKSLVQIERRQTSEGRYEFPTPPWDGTRRDITRDIGLWRDVGWDLRSPKGDKRHRELRSSTSSLMNS